MILQNFCQIFLACSEMTVYSKPDSFCNNFHKPWWDYQYGMVVCGYCGKCFHDPDQEKLPDIYEV